MSSNFEDVKQLYLDKFKLTGNDFVITQKEHIARADFIAEELFELRDAIKDDDYFEQIDALIDTVYVAMGTAILMGVDWQKHWNEVHRANMKKEVGINLKREGLSLDLVKPKGWKSPDHNKVLNTLPKLMVIGHARHGKDTVCEYLKDKYGFIYKSSSRILADKLMFSHVFTDMYKTVEDCWQDRVNKRTEWFKAIKYYTSLDKTKIAKMIYEKVDIYCGVRDSSELWAINEANMYDYCIWLDASIRLPLEDSSSINVTKHMANIYISNNGNTKDLYEKLDNLMERIL